MSTHTTISEWQWYGELIRGPVMEDRVALVTGSGKERVGNAVAQHLSSLGYRLAIHYFRSEAAASETVTRLREQGADAAAFQADLRQESEIVRLIQEVKGYFGQIDALICAAAVWGKCRFEETSLALLREQWESNTLSTFLCCQHAGMIMTQQPSGGSIVTIGDWATRRPYLNYAAYMVSKGAIPTLTRTMALELGSRNPRVRVNAILPGPVMLPPDLPEEERSAAIAGTLVKKEGSPQHVAHAVQFLLENDFVTGVSLPVDGGRSIYAGGE